MGQLVLSVGRTLDDCVQLCVFWLGSYSTKTKYLGGVEFKKVETGKNLEGNQVNNFRVEKANFTD